MRLSSRSGSIASVRFSVTTSGSGASRPFAEQAGPTLFHPGDAIDTVPDGVDVLALPLAAPWSALKETVEFLRAVAPSRWFPVHEALLSDLGRGVFLRVGGSLAPDGTQQLDLSAPVEI